MRFTLYSLIVPFVLFAGSSLSAQSNEPLVKAKFRVLPVLSANWNGIFYRPAPEEEMVEIAFRSLSRSFLTYDYLGPNPLSFYRESEINDEGQMTYEEIGRCAVNSTEILVFFAKSADENALEFNLIAMNDSPDGLPMDHVAFVNLMKVPFGCKFIDKNYVVQPGVSKPISISKNLNKDLFIGLVVQNEDTLRVVLQNNWKFQTGNRHIILLLPPKKAGSFRIRAYRVTDFVGDNPRFNSSAQVSQKN